MNHLALTAVLLMGCTHRRTVANPSMLVGKQVEVGIVLTPGITTTTEGYVVMGPHGAVVQTQTTPVELRSPGKVTEVRHGTGALEGLAIGTLAGVVSGVLLGIPEGDGCESDICLFDDAGSRMFVGGLVLGVVGGLAGLAIGAARGAHYEYSF